MSYIEAAGVTKSFAAAGGVRNVLRGVSLSVGRGEFVSIVGAMGSGKSTLLSILAGLSSADAGTVSVDGETVTAVRDNAAFVFQNYSLLPWFTALENVRLAVEASCRTLTREEQKARATHVLEQVGLGSALHRRPRQLSGGMRQRVAIARAFAPDPDLLFMDEPFGALDALTRETLQGELMRLCSSVSKPVTTIMITNSVEEALLLSDRIVPMLPGPPATLGAPISVDLPAAVDDCARKRAAGGRTAAGDAQVAGPAGGRRSLPGDGRGGRRRRADPRAAVTRHAAMRVPGQGARRRTAVPAARRAVRPARLAHALRAAGHAAPRLGGNRQDRRQGDARRGRGDVSGGSS